MKYNLIINDREFEVEVGAIQDGYAQVYVNDEAFEVDILNFQKLSQPLAAPRRAQPVMARRVAQPVVARQPQQISAPRVPVQAPAKQVKAAVPPPAASKPAAPKATVSATGAGGGAIKAPMPGLILGIKVQVGDVVKAGQVVAVMEAMKMENDLPSTLDGTVKEICVQKGAQVSTGDVLIVVG